MSKMMRVNEQVLPYLTAEARAKFDALSQSVDPDLALTLVEATMDEVYELPPEEEEGA